jgi:hypothetical protein
MFFGWLKRAARDAVIAGINEAVAELAGAAGQKAGPEAPEVRLLLPYTGPEEPEAPKRGRKAE